MKKKFIDVWGVVEKLSGKCALATGEEYEAFIEALNIVLDAPEVAPQEIRHGEWEGMADSYYNGALLYDMWQCSECGCGCEADEAVEKPNWNFCPNCGAKMDGGQKDAAN